MATSAHSHSRSSHGDSRDGLDCSSRCTATSTRQLAAVTIGPSRRTSCSQPAVLCSDLACAGPAACLCGWLQLVRRCGWYPVWCCSTRLGAASWRVQLAWYTYRCPARSGNARGHTCGVPADAAPAWVPRQPRPATLRRAAGLTALPRPWPGTTPCSVASSPGPPPRPHPALPTRAPQRRRPLD